MIWRLDPEVLQITWLTLRVNALATALAVLLGVPLGVFLALGGFPGRSFLVSLVNMGMGLPPTVVGLLVSLLLMRYGPLGFLGWNLTPQAMVLAQAIIASPLVTGFTLAAVGQLPFRLRLQILALGANRWQFLWLLLREARMGILAAVIAGFGGVVSEVGAAMAVGGNIRGYTRVLTTATVLETSRGNYDLALALSFILLALAYLVTLGFTLAQQGGRER